LVDYTFWFFPRLVSGGRPLWFGGGGEGGTYPHILAHINIECPDDMHLKRKTYISETILDN